MPTGGVSPEEDNLRSWFDAGAYCVGMGSKLLQKDLIESGNYAGISDLVADTLSLISKVRSA